MSARTLLVHTMFALAAMVSAWLLAHRVEEKKGGPTSVTLLDASKGEVRTLEYTWPKGRSSVSASEGAAARRAVVDVDRTVEPKKDPKKKDDKKPDKKDAAADAGPASADAGVAEPEPAPTREQVKFPGGKTVLNAIEALEPLRTRRTLGEVDAARLKEMGLERPERTLIVTTAGGAKLTLEIGESSYGGQGRYARKQGDPTVHLVDAALVTGLEGGPETLMEKRVLVAEPERVLGYTARHGDKGGAFVHVDRGQSTTRHFSPKDDAGTKSEPADAVMKTLRDLRATKLAPGPQGAGSVVATIAVELEGGARTTVELVERIDAAGHLVKLDSWLFEVSETQGKELLEDLDALLP
ncbi:MAG: DUF4340 domain-containing protein [Deltaproteobacteria bacterium]|nr:DUF4340 domain-containing protein [Deltaproteobacteria bacterium]